MSTQPAAASSNLPAANPAATSGHVHTTPFSRSTSTVRSPNEAFHTPLNHSHQRTRNNHQDAPAGPSNTSRRPRDSNESPSSNEKPQANHTKKYKQGLSSMEERLAAMMGGLRDDIGMQKAEFRNQFKELLEESRAERALIYGRIEQNAETCVAIGGKVTAVESTLAEVKTTVASIKSDAERAMEDMDDRFGRLKRERDLTIVGVPADELRDQADLVQVMLTLAAAIGYTDMHENNIDFVRKAVLKKNGGSMLVARFDSVCTRDRFYTHYMTKQDLSTTCFPGREVAERIYVSDNLTYKNAQVRKHAAALKKRGILRAVSIRDGLVHVSLFTDADKRRRQISSIEELDELAKRVSGEQRAASVSNRLRRMVVEESEQSDHSNP